MLDIVIERIEANGIRVSDLDAYFQKAIDNFQSSSADQELLQQRMHGDHREIHFVEPAPFKERTAEEQAAIERIADEAFGKGWETRVRKY